MTVAVVVKAAPVLSPGTPDPYDVGNVFPALAGVPVTPGEAATIAAVASYLRERIYSGELAPGTQTPTRRALRDMFGISEESAGVALRQLRDEGLVSLEAGRGTFVRQLFPWAVTLTAPGQEPWEVTVDAPDQARALALALAEARDQGLDTAGASAQIRPAENRQP